MDYRVKKRSRLIAAGLALILCLAPIQAFGADTMPKTAIDLNSSRDLKGKGYFWDVSKRTLTLTDAKLSGNIAVPQTGDVTIYLKGENRLDGVIHNNGSRKTGEITISGNGTGSLEVYGLISFGAPECINIKNCILAVYQPENTDNTWCFSSGGKGLNVTDNARVFLNNGLNGGLSLNIDHAYVEAEDIHSHSYVSVDGMLSVTDSGELHVLMDQTDLAAVVGNEGFYADSSSTVEIISGGDFAFSDMGKVEILSEDLVLKGTKSAIGHIRCTDGEDTPSIVLPEAINGDYECVVVDEQAYYPVELCEKGTTIPAKSISYTADSVIADKERVKQGVKNTTIKLSSSKPSAKSVKLTWKKSPGYRVDYYEVFRSTQRYKGYTSTPFYSTRFGLKNYYTNTKDLKKGTRYYYKVRGVREIDGQKYYTKWSTKSWRTI